MIEKKKTILASVKKTVKKKRTLQHIIEAFCRVIQCEMEVTRGQTEETYDTHLKMAIQAQQVIGFDIILGGFIAQEWMKALIQQGVPSPEQEMNALGEIIWV